MAKNCYFIFAYAILLVSFLVPCLAKTSTSLATDQSSLLYLKAQVTSDPHRILTRNWTTSSSVCTWIGVTCGLRYHRVIALNISHMSLSGTIPAQLGNLSFLVLLDLRYNLFSGTLPQELYLLHRLKFISLEVNNFRGEIPSQLGLLPRLEHLSLRNNSFTGVIPTTIFNLSTLEILDSASNELSGSLPVDMCSNLPFLEEIHLFENQLSGPIPSNLSQCSKLQILSLFYNSFSGEIHREIGSLKSLQILYLGHNNLNGTIPREIGNLQDLVEFGIERNQITGALPNCLFNMSSLQMVLLGGNKLIGNLSRDIGNLTMLKVFDISNNNLTGVLPREIGQLYQLEDLRLELNTFTGLIPPELFNFSTLRTFTVAVNSLSGGLPSNLCYGLPVIESLLLNVNYFSGAIPNSISNCSRLRILTLDTNEFTGFVPRFLGNLRLIEILNLDRNNLGIESSSSELNFITSLTNCRYLDELSFNDNPIEGVIPASIGNLSSSLQYFYAYNCKIKGSIPADFGNLSNLVGVYMCNNELSGNIPLTVKHLLKLQGLNLQDNNLGGSIPKGLCDLRRLAVIDLSRNQFSGPIPKCLGNVTSLESLFLGFNMLTSSIPSSLWRLKDLLHLSLPSNSLTGYLPPEIGNLVVAIHVNLSKNQLLGSIPSTIGDLQNLVNLSLAHNKLEGSIPVSVGRMTSLVSLDLSYNNLSGSLPKSLESLQYLDDFDVSFNALSGEIPTGGPFRNFTMESFKGNRALCGIQRFHVPLCHAAPNNRSTRKKLQITLFTLVGVVAFFTIVSLAFIFIRYKRKDKTTSGINVLVSTVLERISYYEILQATDQFNESNLLGTGSFGSVYKGMLRDGKTFAVKVFNLQLEFAFKSFDVECEVLRNIRHRNLAKVMSSCSNEDFKAIVLEYMSNGSLEKWLYSHNYCLDVMQRLNIMIDVASALEYLHHGYSTPIVHCDLKPSNILLDEEMIAHVTDFGIAKLLGDGESMVLTSTLATLGYIAPEYGLEGLVSTRCDVYSFGVMLMETFTRKRPSDDMFFGDLSLKSWVESSLPESSSQVIDANLLMNIGEEHFDKSLECISSVLELALKCSAEFPGDRINMKEALAELKKIKHRFS